MLLASFGENLRVCVTPMLSALGKHQRGWVQQLARDRGMQVPSAPAAPIPAPVGAAAAKQGGSRKRAAKLAGAAGARQRLTHPTFDEVVR